MKNKNLSKEYLSFIRDLPINEEMSVITANYGSVLKECAAGINPSAYKITSPSITTVIESAQELGYQFTPQQKEAAKKTTFFENGLDTLSFQWDTTPLKTKN